MRSKDRLTPFYDKLRQIHREEFQDWRFGQLVCNFFGWLASVKGIDPFFPEEDQMIKLFEEFAYGLRHGA